MATDPFAVFGRFDTTGPGGGVDHGRFGAVNPLLFPHDYAYPSPADGDDTYDSPQEQADRLGAVLSSRYVPRVDTQITTVEKRVFEVQAAGASLPTPGKFVVSILDNLWSGVSDPTMYIGYNTTAGGAIINAGEPGFAIGLEANYNDGTGDNKIEWYTQYTPAVGLQYRRPQMIQINRDTEMIALHSLCGANQNGLVIEHDNGTVTPDLVARFARGVHTFYGFAGIDTGFTVIGGPSRNAFIQLGRDGASNTMQLATETNTSGTVSVGGSVIARWYSTPIGAAGAAFAVGANDNQAVLLADVAPSNAGVKGLVVRCKNTQTANAVEVQDSSSVARIFITRATASNPPSLVIGNAALATTATDGFVYVPTCAGPPTGVPTARTGTAAMVYDTTNNRLCVYNGAWRTVTLA